MNNQISFRNTLESTQPSISPTTGALVLKGGLTINCNVPATSNTRGGALTIAGGVSIGMDAHIADTLHVFSLEGAENLETPGLTLTETTVSSSPITGALITFGGIATDNTTDSVSNVNGGTITTAGGFTVAKTLYAKDTIVTGVTETRTGSITGNITIPLGGLGINNPTDSTSSSNGGAMTIVGGAAVNKRVFVGTSIATANIISETLTIECSNCEIQTPGTAQFISKDTIITNSIHTLFEGDHIQFTSNSINDSCIKLDSANGGISIVPGNTFSVNSNTIELNSTATLEITGETGVSIDSDTQTSILSVLINIVSPTTIESNTVSQDTTTSSSIITGSLTVSGGIGVSGQLHATDLFDNNNAVFSQTGSNLSSNLEQLLLDDPTFKTINITSTTDASSSTSGGATTISGGLAVAKQLFVGGSITTPTLNISNTLDIPSLTVTSNIPSTSDITGVLTAPGGIAAASTTDSVSTSNGGALTVAGGVSIAKTTRSKTLDTTDLTSTGQVDLTGLLTVSTNTSAFTNIGINTDIIPKNLSIYNQNPIASLIGNNFDSQVSLFFGTPNSGSTANSKKTAVIAQGISDNSKTDLYFCLNGSATNSDTATTTDYRLVLLNNGDVGIGTSIPTNKLQVSSTANISGDITGISSFTATTTGSLQSISVVSPTVIQAGYTSLNAGINSQNIYTRRDTLTGKTELYGDMFFQFGYAIIPNDILFNLTSGNIPSTTILAQFIIRYQSSTSDIFTGRISLESSGQVRYLGSREMNQAYGTQNLNYPSGGPGGFRGYINVIYYV